jgi:glycosyltransferase involved in cell wall biosynthesis
MENNPPKISIVTPSFNQGTFLEKTIQSVLSQDYSNLEYIIIDGGSTDNSVEIIKKYAERLSYWVSKPDAGQSDAINKGFRKASGDICAWINSDDVYYPGVLTMIAASFEEHPSVDLLYGYHNDVNEKDEVIRKGMYFPFYKHAFKVGFAICQPTSFGSVKCGISAVHLIPTCIIVWTMIFMPKRLRLDSKLRVCRS